MLIQHSKVLETILNDYSSQVSAATLPIKWTGYADGLTAIHHLEKYFSLILLTPNVHWT
jgi:hypothetical protein